MKQSQPGSRLGNTSIHCQESNYTTWRLTMMNLAIRGIDGRVVQGDTFHSDRFPDSKANTILANPPFNVSNRRAELLRDDKRWKYGVPPAGNGSFAWLQHIIHHRAPTGVATFWLANGSNSSKRSSEGVILKNDLACSLVLRGI